MDQTTPAHIARCTSVRDINVSTSVVVQAGTAWTTNAGDVPVLALHPAATAVATAVAGASGVAATAGSQEAAATAPTIHAARIAATIGDTGSASIAKLINASGKTHKGQSASSRRKRRGNGSSWSDDRVLSYLLGSFECRRIKVRKEHERSDEEMVSYKWSASANRQPFVQKFKSELLVRGNIVTTIASCTSPLATEQTLDVTPISKRPPITGMEEITFKSRQYASDAIFFCFGQIGNNPYTEYSFSRTSFFDILWLIIGGRLDSWEKLESHRYIPTFLAWLRECDHANLQLCKDGTLEEILCQSRYAWIRQCFDGDYAAYQVEACFKHAWRTLQFGWKLCVTTAGYIGWVTPHAEPGDTLAIVHGCSFPVVLRPFQGSSAYQVVGDSVMYGLMEGEGLSDGYEELTLI